MRYKWCSAGHSDSAAAAGACKTSRQRGGTQTKYMLKLTQRQYTRCWVSLQGRWVEKKTMAVYSWGVNSDLQNALATEMGRGIVPQSSGSGML
jgi:hypothetical protein